MKVKTHAAALLEPLRHYKCRNEKKEEENGVNVIKLQLKREL